MLRVLFGVLVAASAARFAARGWIFEHFVAPRVFFPYWGFGWVKPLSEQGMTALFAVLGVAALGVAVGALYRLCAVLVLLLFTYAHLVDQTYYLNHYYLVSCLALLACVLPLASSGSVDARVRSGRANSGTVPAWVLYCLRGQVGLVYFFAGVAKLKPDWLFHGEPLRIWLAANSDLPWLAPVAGAAWLAPVMSWAGALFDLSVVPLLSFKRTRPFAYAAVVVFHAVTAQLFQLGLFPWIMSLIALVFFEPGWPRRLLGFVPFFRAQGTPAMAARRVPGWLGAGLTAYFAFQVVMPVRHLLYPGDVSWTEEGFRYSWNVMLVEKSGAVDLSVRDPATGRSHAVSPRDYLTPIQAKMMATQPDMLLTFAHLVGRDFERRGVRNPEVYADVFVSWNGRAAARLVDPTVDLYRERESLAPKTWLLPAPSEPPP
jgi:vitamin K-dependent gamma-carboxylase